MSYVKSAFTTTRRAALGSIHGVSGQNDSAIGCHGRSQRKASDLVQ